MRIGLIDVDGHRFPNLPLMKLSAWHKKQGDHVEFYYPLTSGHMDRVYMSKVFSFTEDYPYYIDADEIVRGGTGYCITTVDGKEIFDKSKDHNLPDEVEHIYPDYSLYPSLTKDTAYGFLSRGCPRGCKFCIVGKKEGNSHKVADLSEFWRGQKNINLLDPNITACKDWKDLFQQLIDSGAKVDFSQGLDVRVMTDEKAEMIKRIKVERVHLAWDRYEDKDIVVPKIKRFKEITGWHRSKIIVYTLTNFNTTFEQDLERIYTLREIGVDPYVTIYNRESLRKGHPLMRLLRWVNNRWVWGSVERFEDYK